MEAMALKKSGRMNSADNQGFETNFFPKVPGTKQEVIKEESP